jgi:hypothetical protein
MTLQQWPVERAFVEVALFQEPSPELLFPKILGFYRVRQPGLQKY